MGGCYSQYDDEGILRPIAYFSAKHSLAEVNYTVYNKEMLAIIKCVNEWHQMLRAVPHTTVFTDY